jgi:peptidoglycan hydrolase-like protein with peptidoglycan-binding domain
MAEYSYAPGYSQRKEGVQLFQGKLNDIRSSYHGGWDSLTVDGSYGKDTENAVREFQKSAGLSPTGVLDNRTMESLNTFCRDRELASRRGCYPGQLTFTAPLSPNQYGNYNNYNPNQYRYEVHNILIEEALWPACKWFWGRTKEAWSGILADFATFIMELPKLPMGKYAIAVLKFLDGLRPKFINALNNILPTIKSIPKNVNNAYNAVKAAMSGLKGEAAKYIKAFFSSKSWTGMKNALKTKKLSTGNWIGIAFAILPFVISLIRYPFVEESEKDKSWKELVDSFNGAIGGIIVIIVTELIAAGIVAGLGLAASSVPAVLIAAVVAIVIGIADIVISCIFGHGIGDYVGAAVVGITKWVIDANVTIYTYLGKKAYQGTVWAGTKAYEGAVWAGEKAYQGAVWTGNKVYQGATYIRDVASEAITSANDAISNASAYASDAIDSALNDMSRSFDSLCSAIELPDWLDF